MSSQMQMGKDGKKENENENGDGEVKLGSLKDHVEQFSHHL